MIIAKTQQESDLLCEQEISHILRIERQLPTITIDGSCFLVDNQNQKFVLIPEVERIASMRTKKYGTLAYFERIHDFLDSKFNKCVLAVYCSTVSHEPRKKYSIKRCSLGTIKEDYIFRDKETSDNNFSKVFMDKDYETNKLSTMESFTAYWIVVQRDVSSENGVRIIDNFKIKSKN